LTRRRFRVRNSVRRAARATARPRLSVFRSNKHIYAQVIDDLEGRTLASASTMEKDVAGSGGYGGNKEFAAKIGKLIAERAMEKGVKEVVFDRGPYQYHGRIAALADAAREAGLQF
ncbi:MAG: 50S ribosomal protein L18, partial [Planctomycetaceae bacterium]|nr:50S ribosomal protein L18 [Planctomycetaceae bacterium]